MQSRETQEEREKEAELHFHNTDLPYFPHTWWLKAVFNASLISIKHVNRILPEPCATCFLQINDTISFKELF